MKKIFGLLALAGGVYSSTVAQADLTYAIASLEGYSRTEVVRLLLTSQYDGDYLPLTADASMDNYRNNTANPSSTNQVKVGDKPFYPELSKDKLPGKEYMEVEVINLNGMYLSDVVIGSVTNTLEKEKRYIEITADDASSPMVLSLIPAIELSMLDNESAYTYTTKKNYTIGTAKGKFFVIADDNSYRYFDSHKLSGNSKLVEELKKGKPITAQTFFYQAQEEGLIPAEMTLKEFLGMSVEEHRKLLVTDEE